MKTENPFLDLLARKARKNRESYWDVEPFVTRLSNINNNIYASLWFKTNGCSHDKRGGCTICDYSNGISISTQDMVDSVALGLTTIPKGCEELLISPSGSMFDSKEVPDSVRQKIFSLLDKSDSRKIAIETRADTITYDKIKETQNILKGRLSKVYIGLETSNLWLLKYCINKNLDLNQMINSYNLLQANNIISASNIFLGIPFLSEKENIQETLSSIKWSFSNGSDIISLFPAHIKKATIGEVLFKLEIYSSPSLWSLIEVLRQLEQEIYENKIEINWYTSMGAYNVISSPYTCSKCYSKVIEILDKFSQSNDFNYILMLDEIKCECKNIWRDKLEKNNSLNLYERVINGYQQLSEYLFNRNWFDFHFDRLINMKIEYDINYTMKP
ncbi:hypothetical protein [Bacteroides sp. 519]|uniref:hypothetical protein n=1 Tax=Bacteroides sp. 519 TaxID=2302937 RepID=UPI0013D4260A|nr:hypothetical protein [Bacteroides sp. 519]NDV57973.1 hypothetical protein [Bacteroides sp. 519]